MNANLSVRGLHGFIVGFALIVLSACGGEDAHQTTSQTQATSTVPTASTSTANPSTPASTTPATPATSETPTAEKPAEVSETGEETVEDAPPAAAQSELKLASAGESKPAASAFKEGVNYQRLVPTQPTNASPGQVEVLEIFWYGCPHCFALDPKLEAWRQKGKANYVDFQRMPATWNEATLFHGRLFYTAEQLGKLEALHTLIFREIHVNGNPLNTEDKAKAFFAAHGVSPADFDKAFNSFGVSTKIQTAGLMNRRYRVEGVPFFVVNGKYTFDVGSAGSEEKVLQLINELAAREHH